MNPVKKNKISPFNSIADILQSNIFYNNLSVFLNSPPPQKNLTNSLNEESTKEYDNS